MKVIEIKDFLKELDIPQNEILFLHVRLKGISNELTYQDLSNQIIKILQELYNPITILVPTFTYSYTKTASFDRANSPSEVGRFSEEVRRIFDPQHRTTNPVFNVIDTNNYFKKYELKEETAFGEDSLMQILHDLGHVVININVNEFISTYLHFLEYHYNVPYRYTKHFPGEVIFSQKEKKPVDYQYFVRDLDKHTVWDRKKIKETLYKEGALKFINRNRLEIMWIHSKDMKKILGKKLETDKEFLLS
jgi:aminoglycoside 3-N-acetyltransferase